MPSALSDAQHKGGLEHIVNQPMRQPCSINDICRPRLNTRVPMHDPFIGLCCAATAIDIPETELEAVKCLKQLT